MSPAWSPDGLRIAYLASNLHVYDRAGYTCLNFGIVSIPRAVGFRIRYEPQGSSIPAGVTPPENFIWVAAS